MLFYFSSFNHSGCLKLLRICLNFEEPESEVQPSVTSYSYTISQYKLQAIVCFPL